MKYKQIFISCLFIAVAVTVASSCFAEDKLPPEELFAQGNDYYEKREYAKAIDEYEKILATGNQSGSLYYNLAGAYFKNAKLGKAILNYERARRIMPRDADLIANYKFARVMVREKDISQKGIWAWWPIRIYYKNLTVDELTWLFSGMYIAIIILFFAVILWPVASRHKIVVSILLFVFIVFNGAVIWRKIDSIFTGGIVIAPRVVALFGPFDSATKFFTLNEGTKIKVLKAKEQWYKVRRADGKVGWVKQDTVEKI